MNKDEFRTAIKGNFSNFSQTFFDKIEIYKNELQEFNKHTNLTKLDKEEIIYEQYFYDSIIPYKNIDFKNNTKLLDIGSGSGIPGVVLKILFEETIDLVIIESNGKKVKFLNLLANKLNIKIKILNKRAEEITNNERDSFDIVTSRAVAELKVLIEISVPYLKLNGLLIEPKSLDYDNEYKKATEIIKNIGIELVKIDEFNTNNKQHNVFCFKKIKPTSAKYPRQ
jgi:16S rRNA (guanine527-N7)-methyltransferase